MKKIPYKDCEGFVEVQYVKMVQTIQNLFHSFTILCDAEKVEPDDCLKVLINTVNSVLGLLIKSLPTHYGMDQTYDIVREMNHTMDTMLAEASREFRRDMN